MANRVKIGQPIPLSLQLGDDDETLFPQAVLRDPAGSVVATVDLPHLAGGLYYDESEPMPAQDRIFAQYKVYSNAGHTQEDPIHCDTIMEVFERDLVGEKVDSISTALQAFSGNLDFLTGTIDDGIGELIGTIDDNEYLSGKIEDDGSLSGVIEENLLVGQLYDEGQLTGVIEC